MNKFDDPTVNWDKVRYDEIVGQLGPFLKSIGYGAKDTVFLPISGYTGINLSKPLPEGMCPWYSCALFLRCIPSSILTLLSGPTMLQVLDSLSPLERADEAPLRIPILDKYKESGKVFILGKVEQGILRSGDDILLQPGNVKFQVFQIQNDENIITIAKPGENVKIIVRCTQGTVIQPSLP